MNSHIITICKICSSFYKKLIDRTYLLRTMFFIVFFRIYRTTSRKVLNCLTDFMRGLQITSAAAAETSIAAAVEASSDR